MRRVTDEERKKLAKYTKEEIIEALASTFMADLVVSEILNKLEHYEKRKAIADAEAASNARIEAGIAMAEWQRDMCVKYGDGKTCKLSNIPREEIERGARLEKALEAASKKSERLEAKVNKLLGLPT